MAKAWNEPGAAQGSAKVLDWRKKMSDNIAYALLV